MNDVEERKEQAGDVVQVSAGAPLAAMFVAWLVPGAGHYYLGKRFRGVAFAILVFAAFSIGASLGGNLHHVMQDQPLTILSTLGSMGSGAAYFVARYLLGYQGDVMSAGYEYGSAFILTAGLMNLLLVLDVLDIARGKKE